MCGERVERAERVLSIVRRRDGDADAIGEQATGVRRPSVPRTLSDRALQYPAVPRRLYSERLGEPGSLFCVVRRRDCDADEDGHETARVRRDRVPGTVADCVM